jgi:hypothetical protein
MKKNILFFLLFFSKICFSCQCPQLQPISKDLCTTYNVIFFGKVDSVKNCGTDGISTAYFTLNELYKGAVEQHVKIDFDCASDCMMNFSKGDQWLIYSSFQRFDLMTVNICEHSRKFFSDASQDIYQIASHRTFVQEKQFLNATFGIQPYVKNNELNKLENDLRPHNDQPSSLNKLLLLLVSFIAMGIVYYITRNKNKK